jgi:hypothetical protein
MKSKIHHSAALLLLLTSLLLPAEDQADEKAAETKQLEELEKETEGFAEIPTYQSREPGERSFAVYCPKKPDAKLFYMRGENPEEVHFNTEAVRTFQYTSQNAITLFKKVVDATGKETLKPVFLASPPADSRDGILILDQKRFDHETPIKVTYVDLSSQSLSKGGVRLVNLTARSLLVQLGESKKSVAPLSDISQQPDPKRDFYPVRIGVRVEDETQLIYRNTLQTEPNSRVLMLIIPNANESKNRRPIRCILYKDMGNVRG